MSIPRIPIRRTIHPDEQTWKDTLDDLERIAFEEQQQPSTSTCSTVDTILEAQRPVPRPRTTVKKDRREDVKSNGSDGGWEILTDSIPTATLVDTSQNETKRWSLVDPMPSSSTVIHEQSPFASVFNSSTKLIDIDDTESDRYSPPESSILILQTVCEGFKFDLTKPSSSPKRITLERGSLLKGICELDDPIVVDGLNQSLQCKSSVEILQVRDISNPDIYANVRKSDVMRLTDIQAKLLQSASPSDRIKLHLDLERFNFVEHLKVGSEVDVVIHKDETGEKEKMRRGLVKSIGERNPERHHPGTWFQVQFPQDSIMNGYGHSPQSLYLDSSQLYKPTRSTFAMYDNGGPVSMEERGERIIPIRRVDTREEERRYSERRSHPDENYAYNRHQHHRYPNETLERDLSWWDGDPRTVVSSSNREREDTRRNDHSQPSRSHSAHVLSIQERTISVDDANILNGVRKGDVCIYHDARGSHKGIIRFLGYLKGHSNLYAGVEFDEAVGKGTGVFQGEPIFSCDVDHAGFVLLGSLEVLKKKGNQPKTISIKHKQASAESLSDLPHTHPPAPPPIPPRPVMRAEDYMIESFPVGTSVEVCYLGASRSGIVRWLGDAIDDNLDRLERSAVVELEEEPPSGWRSAWEAPAPEVQSTPYGVLIPSSALKRSRKNGGVEDGGESDLSPSSTSYNRNEFGSMDSGIEKKKCEPWKLGEELIGRMKGIQGHRNSCYLDAMLYAMFAQSTTYDFLLERKADKNDIPQYSEIQRLIATEIVYPLRKFHYVRADHVMKVRQLLSQILPSVKGLTSEEKDPEEILAHLFTTIFKAQPLLELINLKDNKRDRMFICPLIVEDWNGGVATTQHLLERSMKAAQVKFFVAPKALILQLPRYGQTKLFDKILPLERIDITGLVNDAVVGCRGCSSIAECYCPECYICKQALLPEVSYCLPCFKKFHHSSNEDDHTMRDFYPASRPKKPTSHKMVLSAVLCIETSHYVAFVRSVNDKWLFFDSMADREGLSDGFNIPQTKECDKMSWWLSAAGWNRLKQADDTGSTKVVLGRGSDVDPLVTRLLSDSYICFYQEEYSPPPSKNIFNNVIKAVKKDFSLNN